MFRWSMSSKVRRVLPTLLFVGSVLVFGAEVQAQQARNVGLNGYCPVCVIEAKKWEKGSPNIVSIYDGTTYRFPSDAIKQKFDASPAKYVPALGGDCTVCYAKAGKRVPGSVRHGTLHNNRLFLFPSAKELEAFRANPSEFENVDLAAGGDCVVCLAKGKKHVPGSPQHTEFHNGFRYLFPSSREAGEFRRNPNRYAGVDRSMRTSRQRSVGGNQRMDSSRLVTISGTSACAGCEFGVTPLTSPDELGLAIKTQSGEIVVIEMAHKLYPAIYAARFQGQKVQVRGRIVKSDGKIAWLNPSSAEVIN